MAHHVVDVLPARAMHEVGVADLVLPVEQVLDAGIDPGKQRHEIDAAPLTRLNEKARLGHQLLEAEAAAQGRVEKRDRAVGGVHGADDVEVVGNPETVARGRKATVISPGRPRRLSGSMSVISSPKTFEMLARLISSMTRTN